VRRAGRSGDGALDRNMITPQRIAQPHAPLHQLSTHGAYIVTAGTYKKAHHFHGRDRLNVLHRGLLSVARQFGSRLEAWSVFSNHYHFVGRSPDIGADNLPQMLDLFHEKTAKWVNKLDKSFSRDIWHNFWETKLTHRNSYLARLNHVHQNPVRHGLAYVANQYPWCSGAWFERTGTARAGSDDFTGLR
jgi:putative transposase